MTLRRGDMWEYSDASLFLFTGNASVRTDGCLVMGRGAALQAQRRFPNCNQTFGQLIRLHQRKFGLGIPYGVILHPDICLGVFQVKWDWNRDASIDLIRFSVDALIPIAEQYQSRKKIVACNFPGIGYGGLYREDVLPLLKPLPRNVEIWEY